MNTIPSNNAVSAGFKNTDFKLQSIDTNVQNSIIRENADSINQPRNQERSAPSTEKINEALQLVNKAAVLQQRSLSFSVDEASGRSIIKVMDKTNDQIIRQIPSEELLKVAQDIKKLQEEMGQSLGFLIDRQV